MPQTNVGKIQYISTTYYDGAKVPDRGGYTFSATNLVGPITIGK